MSELLGTLVSELAAVQPPDIPLAPGVNIERDNPFYVTVPILKIGATSVNPETGTWTKRQVQNVVRQINEKRPEGGIGHVPRAERGSRYDLPALRWVGAQIVDDTAWAKAYVPSSQARVREYFEDALATKARVGTSVYGRQGKQGLNDMTLENIDLGHPDRLGLAEAAAIPKITQEMENDDMAEENNAQKSEVVSELAVTNRLLGTEHADTVALVAEYRQMEGKAKLLDNIVAELDLSAETPMQDVRVVVAELQALRAGALVSDIDAMLDKTCEKNTALKPYLEDYLVAEQDGRKVATVSTIEEAQTRLASLLERDHIKNLQKRLVSETMGPDANGMSAKSQPGADGEVKEPSDEEYAATLSRVGVTSI